MCLKLGNIFKMILDSVIGGPKRYLVTEMYLIYTFLFGAQLKYFFPFVTKIQDVENKMLNYGYK